MEPPWMLVRLFHARGLRKMVEDDDWRLCNQESYMMDLAWRRITYRRRSKTWDHDHCNFCWATFMEEDYPDVLHECYAAENHWVCPQCFEDFKERFRWSVDDTAAPD